MTTKKSTKNQPRKSTTARRPSVAERARSIIADIRRYDFDTRLTLALALRDGVKEKSLRVMCEQAEAGEYVVEPFVGEHEHDYRGIAMEVVKMLDVGGLPDFLLEVITSAINEAASYFSIEVWLEFPDDLQGEDYEGAGYSVERLADLFRIAGTYTIPKPTLAEHLSAVLKDEELPGDMRGGFFEHLHSHGFDDTAPEFIRLVLDRAKQEKGDAQ
jgi:hypothetical protein